MCKIKQIISTVSIVVLIAISLSISVSAQTIISTNTTWTTNQVLTGDIIVNSGVQFTILSTVDMPNNSKIIVMPKASLVIGQGGEIKSTNYPWLGIEVWGDNTKPQTYFSNGMPEFQGEVIIKDQGIIRDAITGVKTIKDISPGVSDWSKTGGIVKLNNAWFIDCGMGVWIGAYHNVLTSLGIVLPNASYIKNSLFEIDRPQITNYNYNFVFIGLYDVDKINILGNTFINYRDSEAYYRGTGILSYSSTINVNQLCTSSNMQYPCTSYQKNGFHNLRYGIRSFRASGLGNINVQNNIFKRCYRSIYTSNGNSDIITNNDIDIAEFDYGMQLSAVDEKYPTGIYIDGGKGFTVQENDITITPASAWATLLGIVVNNTGAVDNEIYNNNISNVNVGIGAFYQNKGIDPKDALGLKLICNYFNNPSYDHWISGQRGDPSKTWIGINFTQGINTGSMSPPYYLPAAEHFSTIAQLFEFDYRNTDANILNYIYDANATTYEARPSNYDHITPYGIYQENTCPSKQSTLSGPGSLSIKYSQLANAQVKLNSSKLILSIWENGGNANLEQEVETIGPWDIYVEFNGLLAESPYLNDEVILACIENPNFTSLMIKLIMIANPHSSRSDLIMESIYNRIPQLPESYIQEILNESETVSPLDELIGHVSMDNHLVNMIGEDIKRIYKEDTVNIYAKDSLIAFVSRQPDLMHRYELASVFLGYNMIEELNICLLDIPSDFGLIDMEQEDYNNILSVFQIAEQVYSEEKYIGGLSENQAEILENMIDLNRPVLSPTALGLMMRHNPEYKYNEPYIELPTPSDARRRSNSNTEQLEISSSFSFYPNPAHDFITLNITTIADDYNLLLLEIYSAKGEKVFWKNIKAKGEQLIDLSQFGPGSYTISLFNNGELLETKKLSVIK